MQDEQAYNNCHICKGEATTSTKAESSTAVSLYISQLLPICTTVSLTRWQTNCCLSIADPRMDGGLVGCLFSSRIDSFLFIKNSWELTNPHLSKQVRSLMKSPILWPRPSNVLKLQGFLPASTPSSRYQA